MRARSYRLRFDSRAEILRLSVPERASAKRAIAWAQGQTDWVAKQCAIVPDRVVLADGVHFQLEGRDIRIHWDAGQPRSPRLDSDVLVLGGPMESIGPRVLRWLKMRARDILSTETLEIAAREKLSVASVSIGDPRSRWGSCAANAAIRYSWRLILAPAFVRRATVAHEVAHLLHMDHSARFHAAHARLLGEDPAPAKAWLRQHGVGLHQIIG
ncbi:MAG: YgjP-like metallopeptidase domain-containing protein [Sphingobium sp.]